MFNGVGIRKTTLVADNLFPKLAFTEMLYDTCVVPISFTVGITRKGNLTFDVERYLYNVFSVVCCGTEKYKNDSPHQFKFAIGRNKAYRAG